MASVRYLKIKHWSRKNRSNIATEYISVVMINYSRIFIGSILLQLKQGTLALSTFPPKRILTHSKLRNIMKLDKLAIPANLKKFREEKENIVDQTGLKASISNFLVKKQSIPYVKFTSFSQNINNKWFSFALKWIEYCLSL